MPKWKWIIGGVVVFGGACLFGLYKYGEWVSAQKQADEERAIQEFLEQQMSGAGEGGDASPAMTIFMQVVETAGSVTNILNSEGELSDADFKALTAAKAKLDSLEKEAKEKISADQQNEILPLIADMQEAVQQQMSDKRGKK